MLEDALRLELGLDALLRHQAVVGQADDLARGDVADVLGADDVEGAGLARDDPTLAKPLFGGNAAEHQRTDAVGVAEGIQGVLAGKHHGVATLDHLHGVGDALAQVARLLGEVADELGGDLGVGVGAERDAQVDHLAAERVRVDEGAVVRQRDDHVVDGGQVGLRGLPTLGPGGAVAHVAHGQLAGERRQVGVGEHLVDQTQVLADKDGVAVAHGDAGGLLPAVLQGKQSEVGQSGDVAAGRPDAEDAALVVQDVTFRLGVALPLLAVVHLLASLPMSCVRLVSSCWSAGYTPCPAVAAASSFTAQTRTVLP